MSDASDGGSAGRAAQVPVVGFAKPSSSNASSAPPPRKLRRFAAAFRDSDLQYRSATRDSVGQSSTVLREVGRAFTASVLPGARGGGAALRSVVGGGGGAGIASLGSSAFGSRSLVQSGGAHAALQRSGRAGGGAGGTGGTGGGGTNIVSGVALGTSSVAAGGILSIAASVRTGSSSVIGNSGSAAGQEEAQSLRGGVHGRFWE